MNRRRLLATTAALASTAGCLGIGNSKPEATNLDVTDVTVTPELVAMNSPDSIGTYGDRDEQFMFATVEGGETPTPEYDEIEFEADETYAPMDAPPGENPFLRGWDAQYEGTDAGWVGFRLPKPLDATDAAITWPGGEHALDDGQAEVLAREPVDFEIDSFEAPDSAAGGEGVTTTLTVENVGSVAGTFVGAVNRVGPLIAYTPVEAITLDVPAGETATWEYTYKLDDSDDVAGRELQLNVNWRGGSQWITVDVESA